MHTLIEKLLKKRGINTVLELSDEERGTFDGWQKVLSKEKLTLEDVEHFCQNQVGLIENKWKDLEVPTAKKAELLPYHTCYKAILEAISAPQGVRAALETQLTQLLNS